MECSPSPSITYTLDRSNRASFLCFFHISFETCNVYGKKQHASNARQNKKEPYHNIYCDPFYAVFLYLFISQKKISTMAVHYASHLAKQATIQNVIKKKIHHTSNMYKKKKKMQSTENQNKRKNTDNNVRMNMSQ